MPQVLAISGVGLLVVAIVVFFRRPAEAIVRYKGLEFGGPVAMAALGVCLVLAAVVKSSAANPTDDSSSNRSDQGARPEPLPPPRHRSARGQTISVPFYGALEVGGSCQGEHLLVGTWNCDASRTKRVHCQNEMVVVELCPTACVQHANGQNDECQ